MNKVLVTGLGIAKDIGICESCNLDFSWLINNPSVLLWADQLIMPTASFEAEIARKDEKSEKVISLFLKMADKAEMISKVNLSELYQEKVSDDIYKQMMKDKERLISTFPQVIKSGDERVPDEILIEEQGFCGPWMSSIYASIRVANDLDANCLFSKREHTFLKYLYGLDAPQIGGNAISNVYNEVFSLYMPELNHVHSYAFTEEERCVECAHYEECKDNYLYDTQTMLEKIMKWREYDELQQAKEEINKIIKVKNDLCSENDIKDVVNQFKERQDKINKNINKRFPKIERWTKMTTVVATPITIASAISGNIPLTIGSAVATGVAEMTEQLMEVYRSKNNWVGFVNDMKNM